MAQNLNVLSGYLFDFNAINSKTEWGGKHDGAGQSINS